MVPTPTHVWLYTGVWPFSVYGVKLSQVWRRYPDVVATGWYPQHRVLVEVVGVRDGEDVFRVSKYDADPRPAFAAAATLPTC